MATVYILYSKYIDSFYTGSCLNFRERLKQHLDNEYSSSFTTRAKDWKLFLKIDGLEYQQARRIEKHIKKMKSKVYIQNLKKYPNMILKLISDYK